MTLEELDYAFKNAVTQYFLDLENIYKLMHCFEYGLDHEESESLVESNECVFANIYAL